MNYNHISHTHCWNQQQPSACGISLDKHTQCCLCDLVQEKPTHEIGWEEEFDAQFPNRADLGGAFKECYLDGGYCSTNAQEIKDFIKRNLTHQKESILSKLEGKKWSLGTAFTSRARGYNQGIADAIDVVRGV